MRPGQGYMRLLPMGFVLAVAAMSAVVTTSCKDDSKLETAEVNNSEDVPTMLTRNVETLISDSGVTRYQIITPVWYVYDEVDEPYWRFPDGLNLNKFDDFFRTDATVSADSAIYLKNKQLWRLDGNVNISNVMNEKFLTQQLFWDQRGRKLYSDSFIHIERTDRVLEGYGFESNEQMTRYTIKKVSGIFPASEFKRNGSADDETEPTGDGADSPADEAGADVQDSDSSGPGASAASVAVSTDGDD